MCVRCEPAAPAAARARVLNAARMERACPLHVRCGCLGRRGAGLVTATTRALRGSEIPSPPSAQSETDDGTFQDLRGLHSYRVLETKQKCAALVTAALPPESRKCAKVCCPAPAKSKVYSVVSAMTRTSLIFHNRESNRGHVACRVYIVSGSGMMRQCAVCPLWVLDATVESE